MPREQSVRGQSGSDRVHSAIQLGPSHGATYRPWVNQCHGLWPGLRLPSHKIGEVDLQPSGVDGFDRPVLVVHPAESGTNVAQPDIMVMA